MRVIEELKAKADDAKKLAKLVLRMESEGVFGPVSAATVLEAIRLSQSVLWEKAERASEKEPPPPKVDGLGLKLEYKKREKFQPGEVFMIEKLMFMSIYVPPPWIKSLRSLGYASGNNMVSAVVGGELVSPSSMMIMGKICGCHSSPESERTYPVIPYALIETGGVEFVEDVRPGEMFIHGDVVFLKCHYDGNLYVTALDGSHFVTERTFIARAGGASVTVLKPEFPKGV